MPFVIFHCIRISPPTARCVPATQVLVFHFLFYTKSSDSRSDHGAAEASLDSPLHTAVLFVMPSPSGCNLSSKKPCITEQRTPNSRGIRSLSHRRTRAHTHTNISLSTKLSQTNQRFGS